MEKKWKGSPAAWLAGLACLLAVLCLMQVRQTNQELRQELAHLQTELNREMAFTGNNILNGINDRLSTQASLLYESNWAYESLDRERGRATLLCRIVPKEYDPSRTQAVLEWGGMCWLMTPKETGFLASVEIPMGCVMMDARVILTEEGTRRIENLDWGTIPNADLRPTLSAGFSGMNGGSESQLAGDVSIGVYQPVPGVLTIRSMELVIQKNETEIARTPVALVETEAGVMVQDQGQTGERGGGTTQRFSHPLQGTYPLKKGQELFVYVDVTDTNGLRYRILAGKWERAKGGGLEQVQLEEESRCYKIYDEQNNLIYDDATQVVPYPW